jgi:alpha-glucoside transport system substrate-binding protein
MKGEGFTPWCLGVRALGGESGWPGTDWIEDLVLHEFGGEVYDEWVAGGIPFDDPRIEEAFTLFDATTLETGQTFNGRRGILSALWNQAGEPLFTDPPSCFLHRIPNFWRGSLPEGTSIGPDGDVDVFPLPVLDADVGEAVLVGGDTAAAFTDRQEAMILLEYLASPESGEPWAAEGGYISPHRNFDPEAYRDPFDRRIARVIEEATLLRFDGSDLMPVALGEGTFREGMLNFVRTRDFASTVRIIEAGLERPTSP